MQQTTFGFCDFKKIISKKFCFSKHKLGGVLPFVPQNKPPRGSQPDGQGTDGRDARKVIGGQQEMSVPQ